jgi:hypothetical protein
LLASEQVDAKRQLEVLRQLREQGRKLVANNIGARPSDTKRDVEVTAGRAPQIFVDSPTEVAQPARHGAHFGLEVGAGLWGGNNLGYYGSAGPFLDVGLGPVVGFRVGLRVHYGTIDHGSGILFGIPVSCRLNIGSVYAIVLGVNMGLRVRNNIPGDKAGFSYGEAGFFFGPELSLLNFRFGEKRDFELAAVQGYAASVSNSLGVGISYNTFTFSKLW